MFSAQMMPWAEPTWASMSLAVKSPMAQMPGTLVAMRSSTSTAPRSVSFTPTSSNPRPRPLGLKPMATRACSASKVFSPSWLETLTCTPVSVAAIDSTRCPTSDLIYLSMDDAQRRRGAARAVEREMNALVERERHIGEARVRFFHRRAELAVFRHVAAQQPVLDVVERVAVPAHLEPRALEEAFDLPHAAGGCELRAVAQHTGVEHVDPEGALRRDAHAFGMKGSERLKAGG